MYQLTRPTPRKSAPTTETQKELLAETFQPVAHHIGMAELSRLQRLATVFAELVEAGDDVEAIRALDLCLVFADYKIEILMRR